MLHLTIEEVREAMDKYAKEHPEECAIIDAECKRLLDNLRKRLEAGEDLPNILAEEK